MNKIKTLNNISNAGLSLFDKNLYELNGKEDENAIIVRSASLLDYNFSKNTYAIARAGAGVNNIPIKRCSEEGIIVFNTKGANANAVKELLLGAMFISSRNILDGALWVNSLNGEDDIEKQVEKGKSKFLGHELKGKKVGVIGLGAIGVLVCNSLLKLQMDVYGYDSYLSLQNAFNLSNHVKLVKDINKIYKECDFITYHIPLTDETKGIINEKSISLMKDGVHLFNFSRGGLLDDKHLLHAIKSGKVASYSTDFPNKNLINHKNVYIYPHLGASTKESEDNCAILAVRQIKLFLEFGEIENSVNMKNVSLERVGKHRISIVHKNEKNMLSTISAVFSNLGINISDLINKSNNEIAYTLIDIDDYNENLLDSLNLIEGVLKTRQVY